MSNITNILAKLRPSATFLSLRGYTSATSGEVADHTICFHMSYENALKRSITILSAVEFPKGSLEAEAQAALLASYSESLKPKEEKASADAFSPALDADGNPIKGCKIHRATGTLHLYGLAHRKVVRVPGTYKEVKSRPETIAKNKLVKDLDLPVGRFRQFIIAPGQFEEMRVESLTLLPE